MPPSPHEQFTPRALKNAVLELLKYGLLEEAHKPNLYRTALSSRDHVARVLEPLDLAMKIDEVRGWIFNRSVFCGWFRSAFIMKASGSCSRHSGTCARRR